MSAGGLSGADRGGLVAQFPAPLAVLTLGGTHIPAPPDCSVPAHGGNLSLSGV